MDGFDGLNEPLRCPHGRLFYLLSNGAAFWVDTCRACEVQTVAASAA